MMQIWKYALEITDEQVVLLPKGAKLLTVQMQGSALCLWALVDSEEPLVERTVFVVGTGNDIPRAFAYPYIGTAQMAGGALVWHVFAELR